jgi:Ca-activated chloride channel homolog
MRCTLRWWVAVQCLGIATLWLPPASLTAQEITLEAPDEGTVGAAIEVRWQGGSNTQDFITIVPSDAPEGRYQAYQYASKNPVSLVAPALPGNYEIRYLSAVPPYATLMKRPITVKEAVVTLDAAASVPAGDELSVSWSGPNNPLDFITLVPVATAEGQYKVYTYTNKGSPLTLRAPDVAGEYELRYLLGSGGYPTLGRRAVTVTGIGASIEAPETIAAGSTITIGWQGPDNAQDFITIVPVGTAARAYDGYVYTASGNPATMNVPEVAGDYEIRYLTGQSYATLAARPLTVTAVSATLDER